MTGILLVAGTPAPVNWQLAATAEVAILSGVLAAMLLDYERGLREMAGTVNPRVFFWCGLALWIHPVAACAVLALMLTVFLRSPLWHTQRWEGLRDVVLARGPASRPARGRPGRSRGDRDHRCPNYKLILTKYLILNLLIN